MSIENYTDESFKEYYHKFRHIVQEIKLPADLNSSVGQLILSQLDEVYAYLRIDLADLESATERAESIIRQNERSKAVGRNEEERKREATLYLESYPVRPGDPESPVINMYDYYRKLNTRYSQIKSLVDVISNKQQRLITMSGFMKIEGQLTQY